MKHIKFLTCVTSILLWALLFAAHAEAPRDPYQYFFDQSFGDYSEELENAREQGKKGVMVFFEMDECPFCHRMKDTIMNQPEVQEYYRERFILLAHDIEGDIEIVDFEGNDTTQKEYAEKAQRVRATPVFAFFDLEGNRIARYIGATKSVQEFMWLADYVADGHYKNTSFTRYKRGKKEELAES